MKAKKPESYEDWRKRIYRLSKGVKVYVNRCDECKRKVDKIIGCPDGAEICQQCFDAGKH